MGTSKAAKDAGDVRRFLNHLLGLPLGLPFSPPTPLPLAPSPRPTLTLLFSLT